MLPQMSATDCGGTGVVACPECWGAPLRVDGCDNCHGEGAVPCEAEDCETAHGTPHLHVYSYATDCDGPIERSYVDRSRGLSEWIGDQITMAFARGNPEPSVTGAYDERATVSYATEEGGVTVEAVVCADPCEDTSTYRDIRAEQAGY